MKKKTGRQIEKMKGSKEQQQQQRKYNNRQKQIDYKKEEEWQFKRRKNIRQQEHSTQKTMWNPTFTIQTTKDNQQAGIPTQRREYTREERDNKDQMEAEARNRKIIGNTAGKQGIPTKTKIQAPHVSKL